MKFIFTLCILSLFSQLLPAQEISFPSNLDSFQLCAFAATEDGNPIGNVNYQLGGYSNDPNFPDIFEGGCVTINDQYITGSLTLNPLKDINHLNGVSTFDMVLIVRHILGVQLLPSPYKMIAADANRSGSISIIDLIELRKLIIGMDSTFSDNTSWRFIDSSFVFPNPMNPWETAFPEICIINTIDEDITKNYIGIKIGDVNGSAVANDSLMITDDRTLDEQFVFYFENQEFKNGEVVNLVFKTQDFKNISGFQFELNFDHDKLEFIGFEKGVLEQFDESNFGFFNIQDGAITSSWVNLSSDQKDYSDEILFYLKFKSLKSGNLKEVIRLSENCLKAEAYNDQLAIKNLTLEFIDHNNISTTELFQNQPNPFQEETYISFYITETQSIKLQIFDIQGNPVRAYRATFEAGYNQFFIPSNHITLKGVYFYQLITENENFTKKMIKI